MSFMWNNLVKLTVRRDVHIKVPKRCLNLMEYQSKHLLKKSNVAVQDFFMVDELDSKNGKGIQILDYDEYVIKAQILAGGRGKGHFDNGFKGGVHVTKNRKDIESIIKKMLGYKLITKQTPPGGIQVKKVMVAESVNIKRETYFCILMDRQKNGPVLVASPAGGVDIETVAKDTPHLIKTIPIDIFQGVTENIATQVADFLEFKNELRTSAAQQIQNLWQFFLKVDAVQLEINPLVETDQPAVIAVDAKINFDDNAEFRQREIFALEDSAESDPREVEAAKHNLTYIGMTGNIGCLVNGAGLAMATLDLIKLHGGDPANFLDLGGGVREEQVKAAFDILTSDKNVKCIFVNVFGGIVNCATIANGIVGALKSMELKIPLVVRLEGTNTQQAREILKLSGLKINTSTDFEEAAKKAVQCAL